MSNSSRSIVKKGRARVSDSFFCFFINSTPCHANVGRSVQPQVLRFFFESKMMIMEGSMSSVNVYFHFNWVNSRARRGKRAESSDCAISFTYTQTFSEVTSFYHILDLLHILKIRHGLQTSSVNHHSWTVSTEWGLFLAAGSQIQIRCSQNLHWFLTINLSY